MPTCTDGSYMYHNKEAWPSSRQELMEKKKMRKMSNICAFRSIRQNIRMCPCRQLKGGRLFGWGITIPSACIVLNVHLLQEKR